MIKNQSSAKSKSKRDDEEDDDDEEMQEFDGDIDGVQNISKDIRGYE